MYGEAFLYKSGSAFFLEGSGFREGGKTRLCWRGDGRNAVYVEERCSVPREERCDVYAGRGPYERAGGCSMQPRGVVNMPIGQDMATIDRIRRRYNEENST